MNRFIKCGKIYGILLTSILFCYGCLESDYTQREIEKEILEVEQNFNKYVDQNGIRKAFLTFAADSAVIVRGEQIIKGKKAISNYFKNLPYSEIKLSWMPKHVSVSKSGDMAYTYGTYLFSAVDSTEKIVKQEGIFHTVWQRQADGTWKFVYD